MILKSITVPIGSRTVEFQFHDTNANGEHIDCIRRVWSPELTEELGFCEALEFMWEDEAFVDAVNAVRWRKLSNPVLAVDNASPAEAA